MIAIFDTYYTGECAITASVCISKWQSVAPESTFVHKLDSVENYEPGQFFRRELPCITGTIEEYALTPSIIVVDGYVHLGNERSGLGYHLYNYLDGKIPVVGVAKNEFKGNNKAIKVLRGKSSKPLFVTAEGMPAAEAAAQIKEMHGDHRIPSMLKLVDSLSRSR